ncbi:BTAD domain-containing putative transcriptional regulator [Phytohabitans flavus]|uniref:BTAD domain-containing putative transcriptional regulator n=1 Tax=Phytohabitans flavus TaxID=1076124 RepID=UPI0031F0C151
MSALTRGIGSLIARAVKAVLLLATLAGIPYGLLTQIGSPLPATPPTGNAVLNALTEPVSDTLILDVLAVAAWILWAAFTACVLLEIAAAVRGVPAPRLRLVSPLQTLAGWLVAGVTASVLVAAPVIAVAGHSTPAVATTPAHPSASTPASWVTATATTSPATTPIAATTTPTNIAHADRPVYRVAQGDWMVMVAERFLGAPGRYTDIENLNPKFERRDARFPDHWEPGWEVVLPADARDRGPRPHATGTLITAADPAPPPATPALPAPAAPRPTTPGPATTTPPPMSPPASASPTHIPTPPSSSPAISPTEPDGVVPPPGTTPSTSTSPNTASPSPASPSSDPPAQHRAADSGEGVTLPGGGWVGLPLAAALAAAGAMIWLRRRHRYRPQPVDAADTDDSDLRPLPPPVARLRRAVQERAPQLLEPPPPQPTVSQYASGDTDWQPPPSGPTGPTLAGISDIPSGGLGLTGPNAEAAARALLVATLSTGSPNDPDSKGEVVIPADTLTTLLGAHAVQIGPIPRLHITTNLPDALSHLLQLVVNRQRTLQENEADDFDSLRADPYHPPLPPVVLLAEVPDGEQRAELTNTLYLGAPLRINAALLGQWPRGETRTVRADGHTDSRNERLAVLDVSTTVDLLHALREAHTGEPTTTGPIEDAPNVFPPTAAPVTPENEREPDPPAEPTADSETPPPGDPVEPATHSLPATPAPDTDTPTTRPTSAPAPSRQTAANRVRIQLLGGVTIADRDDQPTPALRMHARQLLVYLAVQRNGAKRNDIMEVIWPHASVTRAGERLQTEVGDLRGKIRQAAGDNDVQPVINTGGRYHLNPDLLDIDLWRLVDAHRTAAAATDPTARITALQQAVEADTGDLAAGFDYDWIDRPREQLRRQGFRTRLHLADLVAGTDPQQARDLATAAATLEPYNEHVARQVMRVLARAGDAAGIRTQLQRLRDALAETDVEPSDETIALAAQLQREIAGTIHSSGEPTNGRLRRS